MHSHTENHIMASQSKEEKSAIHIQIHIIKSSETNTTQTEDDDTFNQLPMNRKRSTSPQQRDEALWKWRDIYIYTVLLFDTKIVSEDWKGEKKGV